MQPIKNHPALRFFNGFILLVAFIIGSPLYAAFEFDWSSQTPPTSRVRHTFTAFKDKLWVIGGNTFGDIWNSPDGLTWRRLRDLPPFGRLAGHAAVVFQNRLWVLGGLNYQAVATNGIWSSNDGLTWTSHTTQSAFTARHDHAALVFNNKIWIIGGVDAAGTTLRDVWSSSDGIQWSLVTAAALFTPNRNHPAFVADGRMWTVGPGSQVWSSADGAQWQRSADVSDVLLTDPVCVRHGNRILAIHTYAATQPDKSWVFAKLDGQSTWTQIAFDVFDGSFRDFEAAPFNGRLWLSGREKFDNEFRGKLFTSSDGQNWWDANAHASPSGLGYISSCVEFKNLLVAILDNNRWPAKKTLWIAANGTKWEQISADPPFANDDNAKEQMVVFKNRLFVLEPAYYYNGQNYGGGVWSSGDLFNWKVETSNPQWPATFQIRTAFIFQNQIWIGGTNSISEPTTQFITQLWRSADGATWQPVNFTGDLNFDSRGNSTVVSADGIRIFPYAYDGYYSSDGVNWSQISVRGYPALRVGGDWFKFLVSDEVSALAYFPEFYRSPDALNWTIVPSTSGIAFVPPPVTPPLTSYPRHFLYFKNRLWVVATPTIFSAPWPETSATDWKNYR